MGCGKRSLLFQGSLWPGTALQIALKRACDPGCYQPMEGSGTAAQLNFGHSAFLELNLGRAGSFGDHLAEKLGEAGVVAYQDDCFVLLVSCQHLLELLKCSLRAESILGMYGVFERQFIGNQRSCLHRSLERAA